MKKFSIRGQVIKMGRAQAQHSCGPGLTVGHAEASCPCYLST